MASTNQAILLIAEGLQNISIGLKELVGAVPSKEVTVDKEVTNDVPPITFVDKEEAEAQVETATEAVEEEEGYTLEELNALTVKQLKELADEHDIKYVDKIRKADLIDLIMDGAEEEEEVEPSVTAEINDENEVAEEDTAEETDEDEEDIDIEALSKDELISLIEENELGDVPAKKAKESVAKYEERLREFIYEALEDEEGEETATEEAEETETDDDDDEELTPQDIRDASLEDLKELAKEYEIDVPAKITQAKLAELLIGELFDEEELAQYEGEISDDEEGAEEDEGISEEDLEEMSLSELKALADEYGVKYPKLVKAPKLREIIIAELFAEEDEDDDSDETELDADDRAEELGLNDMDVEELAELLAEHGISAKGKKQALIAKVLKAIDEGIIEIEDEEEGE